MRRGPVLWSVLLAAAPVALPAQSLLARAPNVAGPWWTPTGILHFNFAHRFSVGPAPERKVTGFPTFTLALGLPWRASAGVVYSTNSTVAAAYPNEWEFVGRLQPLVAGKGSPVDLGVAAAWNLAARGPSLELSLARDAGPFRLIALGRVLARPDSGGTDVAAGGAAVLRLTRHVALAGDAVALMEPTSGERVAWSAGLQLAIPSSPHTLSLNLSNTSGTTMQSSSRGGADTRFGFEFTIPITLARYFGRGRPDTATTEVARPSPSNGVVLVHIANLKFEGALEIPAGTTIEWVNDDPVDHTVIAADSSFVSGLIASGQRFRHRFTTPGRYAYACEPHPFMHGEIIVRPAR